MKRTFLLGRLSKRKWNEIRTNGGILSLPLFAEAEEGKQNCLEVLEQEKKHFDFIEETTCDVKNYIT